METFQGVARNAKAGAAIVVDDGSVVYVVRFFFFFFPLFFDWSSRAEMLGPGKRRASECGCAGERREEGEKRL